MHPPHLLRARRSVRVTVAGREAPEHFEKFAPVVVHAGYLLALNLGAARATELLELGVVQLPLSANAGIAETAVFEACFSHILREP